MDEWISTNALADILKISCSCANKWLRQDISMLYRIAKYNGFVLRGKIKINNQKTSVIIRWNIKRGEQNEKLRKIKQIAERRSERSY